jgi:exodeoxyribonuclease X-like protein
LFLWYWFFYEKIGECYIELNEFENAINISKKGLLEIHNYYTSVLFNIYIAEKKSGNFQNALENYERFILSENYYCPLTYNNTFITKQNHYLCARDAYSQENLFVAKGYLELYFQLNGFKNTWGEENGIGDEEFFYYKTLFKINGKEPPDNLNSMIHYNEALYLKFNILLEKKYEIYCNEFEASDYHYNKLVKEKFAMKFFYGYNSSSILKFGKYIGKTIEEIISIDPNYILWCLVNIDHFILARSTFRQLFFDSEIQKDPIFIIALEYYLFKDNLIMDWLYKLEEWERLDYEAECRYTDPAIGWGTNYDSDGSCSVCGMDEWCGTDGCPLEPQ